MNERMNGFLKESVMMGRVFIFVLQTMGGLKLRNDFRQLCIVMWAFWLLQEWIMG